jgi:hypothetical protein
VVAALIPALWSLACSIPPSNATITLGDLPSETTMEWNPVADYLGHRCGALDCHGDVQRNFIIWSCDGLRLSPVDGAVAISGCDMGEKTTAAEYLATYRSLVGLEPVPMSEVVAGGGADPDLLTFVRKARGEEAHKGGQLIDLTTQVGITQDDCITSWLSGNTNAMDCTQAIDLTQ